MRQDMRTNRPTASHREFRLMLLGSPPDMVHGALPRRARPPAYLIARISALLSRSAGIESADAAFLLYPFFSKKATVSYEVLCVSFLSGTTQRRDSIANFCRHFLNLPTIDVLSHRARLWYNKQD